MKINDIKKYIKKISLIKVRPKGQTGLTLIEILIVVGLLGILVSVSFVSYRSITKNVALQNFKQLAELFPIALTTCIASSGWEITRPDGTFVKPCDSLDKLDYTCPSPGTTCSFWSNDTKEYVCLNMLQRIKGKEYEIHVIVNRNDRNNYKILCKELNPPGSSEGLSNDICQESTSSSYGICDDW